MLREIESRIGALLDPDKQIFAAIDGRCGSGKTTLSEELRKIYRCPVIHMDDFFLPPQKRTAERFSVPGNNLDRERLAEEVLIPLRENRPARYRPFSCRTNGFGEETVIMPSPLIIFEGSYSCHPDLKKYYDLTIFLSVSPSVQLRRLEEREGAEKLAAFREKWIPMEETYFRYFKTAELCDAAFITG